jgi:TPR repeat protein
MTNLKPSMLLTAARLAAASLALSSALAFAGPDDDYRAGVKAYQGGDFLGAMQVLRKPADGGHAASQALLAEILDKSDYDEQAVAYYRKSAAQGYPDGEYGLGTMYANGEGVKRDLAEARNWITKAADHGHVQAISTLAHAYMTGGLALDEQSRTSAAALTWIRKAADVNYVPALEYLAKAYRTGSAGLTADAKQADALEAKVRALRGTRAVEKSKKAKPS